MSRADRGRDVPRAMIHRRILDVAAGDPDASLAAIAAEVSGASTDLVERVLDEYGDPAARVGPDEQGADSPDADEQGVTDPDAADQETESMDADTKTNGTVEEQTTLQISEAQRKTLRALAKRPDASQSDLAADLDVTRATVSRRLNAIPGFEWDDRRAFVESVFGTDGSSHETNGETTDGDPDASTDRVTPAEGTAGATNNETAGAADGETEADPTDVEELRSQLADIDSRLSVLEERDIDGASSDSTESPDDATLSLGPDLAHKVVHACMASDRVTEDEELTVLRALL